MMRRCSPGLSSRCQFRFRQLLRRYWNQLGWNPLLQEAFRLRLLSIEYRIYLVNYRSKWCQQWFGNISWIPKSLSLHRLLGLRSWPLLLFLLWSSQEKCSLPNIKYTLRSQVYHFDFCRTSWTSGKVQTYRALVRPGVALWFRFYGSQTIHSSWFSFQIDSCRQWTPGRLAHTPYSQPGLLRCNHCSQA